MKKTAFFILILGCLHNTSFADTPLSNISNNEAGTSIDISDTKKSDISGPINFRWGVSLIGAGVGVNNGFLKIGPTFKPKKIKSYNFEVFNIYYHGYLKNSWGIWIECCVLNFNYFSFNIFDSNIKGYIIKPRVAFLFTKFMGKSGINTF